MYMILLSNKTTDNEIDNRNYSEYAFKEQETTDSNYNKDSSDEEYLKHIPIYNKLNTSCIHINQKSKTEDEKIKETL